MKSRGVIMCEINQLIKISDDPKILGALQELDQYRRSKLKPATKFLTNTPHEQWTHVMQEMEEALKEIIDLVDNKKEEAEPKALDELNDLQISIETLKAIIEPDESKRMESMIRTVNKNNVRYYYCS